jgi:glycosyltransferase involved in cell wall biosynthesis
MTTAKVLYIGHYKDGTGWGNAALNNILAMDAVGIDVVPRAITYEAQDKAQNPAISQLEMKQAKDCNIVVQHTLPHNYVYNADYINIGFLAVESSNFTATGWHRCCNLMDEMWVPSEVTKQQLKDSGVNVPVKVVPHSLNLGLYENVPDTGLIDTLQNTFNFGFVGEFIERKNIKALIQAFHMEFDFEEPVNLFIKTSKRELESIQGYFNHIKRGLKIRDNYKEEVIVTGMPPQQEYLQLLNHIDCFVMPSRGEAFCIPSLEANAMGKYVLYTDGIGLNHCHGQAIQSYEVPCFGAVETIAELDTAYSTWREIDVLDLAKNMRSHYELCSEMPEVVSEQCKQMAAKYSHESVGEIIKEILRKHV